MKEKIFLLILGILIGALGAGMFAEKGDEKWMPVLEQSGFNYLNNSIDAAINDIGDIEKELSEKEYREIEESLNQSMRDLLKLKLYYIPLTTVRQYLYDADRLYILGKKDEAITRLRKTGIMLKDIEKLKSKPLKKAVNELHIMIDELINGIETGSDNIKTRFKMTGEKANLMLLKGGLIINDIDLEKSYNK